MGRSTRRPWSVALLALALVLAAVPVLVAPDAGAAPPTTSRRQAVPNPTVTVPDVAGRGIFDLQADLSEFPRYGYEQQEFFLTGTARAFDPVGALGSDGRWSVAPGATAPYRTRLVVRRPTDPARFNGTVVVEWLNVTAGFDTSPDWSFEHTELVRKGFAWVGVSAQYVGVEGTTGIFPGLKAFDPERYGSLSHPGDAYSYDIYSQAGRALRRPVGLDPLAGLAVAHLIADGESQAASRMTTYVNAISRGARVYDAFLIHSRSSGAPGFTSTNEGPAMPNPSFVRTDLTTPVLVVESENDVLRNLPARQPDSRRYRLWEIAGTSHADEYSLGPAAVAFLGCDQPVNRGPQHYVMHTAVRRLWTWMRHPGLEPPSSPRISVDATGQVVRDASGNAVGGIRSPQLDVPIATLSGFGNTPAGFCGLFGTTTAFTPEQLVDLYGTKTNYQYQFIVATGRMLDTQFLLPDDTWSVIAETDAAPFPA